MARITVIGSLNMDLVTHAPRIPAPGETVIGGDLATVPGGKGANQAVAAARLGAQVTIVGHVGSDVFATRLLETLAADQIDQRYVTPVEGASGVALIVVDAQGQNSIVVASGANAQMTPDDVDAAEEAIRSADVLVLQLEIPLASVRRAAELARQHNVTVVLNPAPAQSLPADLLANVDILIPNESETTTLTGLPVDDTASLQAATAQLLGQGVANVILTLGERGALLAGRATDGALRHFAPFAVAQVVDTTAAGDAFVGALATALAEGRDLIEAVRQGNAAGALTVTAAGAQPSLPTKQAVAALLADATDAQLNGVLQ